MLKIFGKVLLTVGLRSGGRGRQPSEISVHPVHSRIRIICNMFGLFELLQHFEYSVFKDVDFPLFFFHFDVLIVVLC